MILEIFGNNLRKYREEAGLTQERLAKKAGYCRKTINYYEKCRRTPDMVFLEDIATALGKTPVDMITERNET